MRLRPPLVPPQLVPGAADQLLDTLNDRARAVREEGDGAVTLAASGNSLEMARRTGEVGAVQGWPEEARGGGERCAERAPERGEGEGDRVEDVKGLDGAVEEVGGKAVDRRPGQRSGDGGNGEDVAEGGGGGEDSVEELGEEGDGEEGGLRLRLGVGGEGGEAVGDVGLEGIEDEELVILRGVEGGDGGGAAVEAEQAGS